LVRRRAVVLVRIKTLVNICAGIETEEVVLFDIFDVPVMHVNVVHPPFRSIAKALQAILCVVWIWYAHCTSNTRCIERTTVFRHHCVLQNTLHGSIGSSNGSMLGVRGGFPKNALHLLDEKFAFLIYGFSDNSMPRVNIGS